MAEKTNNKAWVQKNRDWLITLAVFISFTLLVTLSGFFLGGKGKEEAIVVEEEASFNIPANNDQAPDVQQDTTQPKSTSFFLRPSAHELLQKLEGLNFQEFKKETKNLPGLRVMWPAYFFSVNKTENQMAEVMLDASEDGFGVVLVTQIDLKEYPEILALEQGKKIWLAAEIIGVDPTGTGQFLLSTEYVRFDDYHPPPKKTKPIKEN